MTDLLKIATWLGEPYTLFHGQIFDTGTGYALDDDQLLGAILRRAAVLYTSVYLCMDNDAPGLRWEMTVCREDGFPISCKAGPTPLAAALAAVESLT